MTYPAYKIAAVTEPPVYLDLQASVKKACEIIAESAQNGAKLVVFGESWLPGYPFWIWLKNVPASMPLTARLFDNSIEINSRETAQLCRAARENDIYVVIGINERDGGTLYNSMLFIDEKGNIPLVRRKLKPTHVERVVWGQGDGSRLSTVQTENLGVLGGLLCWEHMVHGLDSAMCARGEQVHIAAWPSFNLAHDYSLGKGANLALGQAYALRTQTFSINVATVITQEIVDMICDNEQERALFPPGGGAAVVFGPNGQPLNASPAENDATITYVDIDLNAIRLAKMVCDPVGHYARPDVVNITINQTKQETVTFVENETYLEEEEGLLFEEVVALND